MTERIGIGDGSRLGVMVGSLNAQKLGAVYAAVRIKLDKTCDIGGMEVESGAPAQPVGWKMAHRGALTRAEMALALSTATVGVGIESGVETWDGGGVHTFAAVAVRDRRGVVGRAVTRGIPLPDDVAELVCSPDPMELKDALVAVRGIEAVRGGCISALTNGRMDSLQFFTEATLPAFDDYMARAEQS